MSGRRGIAISLTAAAIAFADLAPLALIFKQAVTPEQESFAWPPTWLPQTLTLENFRVLLEGQELMLGLALSLLVAVCTVVLTLALVLPAAYLSARRRSLERPLDAATVVARLFPSIALAVPMAALFVHAGLYNHPSGFGLVLAHTLAAIPIAFLVLRQAFREVPQDLEHAARLDGASELGLFLRVTLPLVRPSLGAAAILVFLLSWDEFAFAMLIQVTNRTLPPLLYYFAGFGYPGMASAIGCIMLVPALAVVFVLEPAMRSGALAGSNR
ncbi:MAG TPA: carbohydrate ABC transporter permease [Candidatus Limnocylindrales bacterium]|nr:carbohydrate ABC transporter permease [Candidatus Limnocylindrales bacterium]